MKPTNFEEKNFTFTAPEGMKNCGDLEVFIQPDPHNPELNTIISCWEITPVEILSLLCFKRVWLQIIFPTQPPVGLTTQSPFAPEMVINSERAENFKRRLVKQFISEEFGAAQNEISDRIPMVEEMLDNFIEFILARGEK